MAAAVQLSARAVGTTGVNPPVGCVIVRDGRVVGRGWTGPGGRPHAEAAALAEAGEAARGATVLVTLEPCAHESARGPACADLLATSGAARIVVAVRDPDPRTDGAGIARLREAGAEVVEGICTAEAAAVLAGFLARMRLGRPHVTAKLATSLDGCIALADGSSRWITGARARAHAHVERARADAILVGGGTLRADAPSLDVRLAGLEARGPQRLLLSRTMAAPDGWRRIAAPEEIAGLPYNRLLAEGGGATIAAFLAAGLVDRLLLYRAPVLIGGGRAALGDIGLSRLEEAHGRWQLADARMLGPDRLEIYERLG